MMLVSSPLGQAWRRQRRKLEAQIMGHMFDMCWPEFIAYCHEVGWRADRIDAGDAKAKVKARVVEPFR
jgi:hypothetical protein